MQIRFISAYFTHVIITNPSCPIPLYLSHYAKSYYTQPVIQPNDKLLNAKLPIAKMQ